MKPEGGAVETKIGAAVAMEESNLGSWKPESEPRISARKSGHARPAMEGGRSTGYKEGGLVTLYLGQAKGATTHANSHPR